MSEASSEPTARVVFRLTFRVEYIDTDAMGVVHHASYFRWLERARVEWLREQGMPYSKLEKEGWGLPLSGAEIRYVRPLVFDDECVVELSLREVGESRVTIGYKVLKNDVVVTEAATHHVACRRKETEKGVRWVPARIPEEWRKPWLQLSERKP